VTSTTNSASIADDGTNGADPTPANNSSTDATPLEAAPDLAVTKDDGGVTTTPGGTVTYTIDYQNKGKQDATCVVLTETVPANTTYTGLGWTCTPDNTAGSTCTLTIGDLAAGASGSTTFEVTVDATIPAAVTSLTNTVSIDDDHANGGDPTPADNTDSDTTPLTAQPDLTITKTDSVASVAAGGTLTYTLAYENVGDQDATGVTLTETVPANTTYTGSGWTCLPE